MRVLAKSIALLGLGLAAITVPRGYAAAAPLACEALKGVSIAHTTISAAEVIAAGAYKSQAAPMGPPADFSKLPAFCRVAGSIHPTADSDIRFELWLPMENWNGKFVQTGNGGAAGSIVYSSLVEPLSRGFAVANTDTGHQGEGGDFSWVKGHPEKYTDFGYRAVHELTLTGKALTAARYGRPPAKSYWYGCSTGGRQGLKEAQRYPEDYDAIVAGAPASNWTPLLVYSVQIQHELTRKGGLPLAKLGLLKEAALAACDATDGVKDRVIGDPAQCHFDPSSIACKAGADTAQCLTPAEVSIVQQLHRGLVTKDGKTHIPGTGLASEVQWAAFASAQFGIGVNYYRNVVAHDPQWDPATLDVDADLARAEAAEGGVFNAMDPDLGRFFAHGGKLITYHGTTDGLIPYGNSVNYFQSVVAKLGKEAVAEHERFYVVPGMDHCSGGEGAFMIDWLGALDAWAETGHAPGALPAAHPGFMPGPPGGAPVAVKPFTRPACVYPQVARYKGSGDTADAASFQCVAP